MAKSTIRKTKVSFRIQAAGTFMVEHEADESPADVLRGLVDKRKPPYGTTLSLADVYLHSEEFDWSLEVSDEYNFPDELGGGAIPKATKVIMCECGRVFPILDDYACVCGRTAEQFEYEPHHAGDENV